MPKVFTSKTQKIGEIGENIAVRFLVKHNYSILERNYTKKWGELDIVAKKDDMIYFIEVKSVACSNFITSAGKNEKVPHETQFRPEENMHPRKMQRMSRIIQTYLLSKKIKDEWQINLLIVYLNLENKKARIKVVENIIL